MDDWIPYGLLHRYPHMGTDDAEVWERFVRANPTAFDVVAYDVAVGASAPFDTVVNPSTGGSVARIYQRRIDLIGRKGGKHTLVEVKKYASTGALGQIEGYALLLKRDHPEMLPLSLVVLAASFAPEMAYLAKEKGITLLTV